jgi:hypothetical protein
MAQQFFSGTFSEPAPVVQTYPVKCKTNKNGRGKLKRSNILCFAKLAILISRIDMRHIFCNFFYHKKKGQNKRKINYPTPVPSSPCPRASRGALRLFFSVSQILLYFFCKSNNGNTKREITTNERGRDG